MKNKSISLGLFVTFAAFAGPKATLRLPVMLDLSGNNDKATPVSAVNPKLLKAGLKPLPATVEVTTANSSSFYKSLEALQTTIEADLQKIGYKNGSLASGYVPGDLDVGNNVTCFTGDGKLVAELSTHVSDMIYSDQYGVHGWKFKTSVGSDEGELDGEAMKWLDEESKTWKNWDTRQDAVLILSHVGDGGDDVQESIIKRCK